MGKIRKLREIISPILNWNKARLDCFVRLLLALFAVRTVNLRECAIGFISPVQIDSRYQRIKRFFSQFVMDTDQIAKGLYRLFFSGNKKVYLTIDRTNWFWGKANINILMVGLAYEGLAIPLFWKVLNKAGNATAQEHKNILTRFIMVFGKGCILGVLGDREFGNGPLLSWLNKQNIPFYMRIKDNTLVYVRLKKFHPAKKLFNELPPKAQKSFYMAVFIMGVKVYLAGARSERGELMIVATNQKPQTAIAIYLRRWEIETLFQGLKSRGFCFEDTHITQPARIEKLMTVLAIGFCWAHKIGEWRATIKPITLNKHKTARRPQYSYFRYGFDLIREAVLQFSSHFQQLKHYLKHSFFPANAITGDRL